jgi:two-component system sensor histidine kinase/response regulator
MNGFLRKPVDGEALRKLLDHYRARNGEGEEYDKLKSKTLKLLHRASAIRLRNTLQEAIDTCRQDFDQAC